MNRGPYWLFRRRLEVNPGITWDDWGVPLRLCVQQYPMSTCIYIAVLCFNVLFQWYRKDWPPTPPEDSTTPASPSPEQ